MCIVLSFVGAGVLLPSSISYIYSLIALVYQNEVLWLGYWEHLSLYKLKVSLEDGSINSGACGWYLLVELLSLAVFFCHAISERFYATEKKSTVIVETRTVFVRISIFHPYCRFCTKTTTKEAFAILGIIHRIKALSSALCHLGWRAFLSIPFYLLLLSQVRLEIGKFWSRNSYRKVRIF